MTKHDKGRERAGKALDDLGWQAAEKAARRRQAKLSTEEEARRIAELSAARAQQTPEQLRAPLVEAEAEAVAMREAEARGDLATSVPGSVEELAARALAKAEALRQERMALPCYAAMYPGGVEPDDPADRADDGVGRRACEAVSAHESCRWLYMLRENAERICPRGRLLERADLSRARLSLARVPKEDFDVVFGIVQGRRKSLELDTVRVARELLRRRSVVVALENGAEMMTGGRPRRNEVSLRGDEVLVVFGGNKGRGKSIAAQLMIAQLGGLYTLEDDYGKPTKNGGVDMAEVLKAPGLVVVDQVGGGYKGESMFLRSQVEKLVDQRRAHGGKTLLVGNVTYQTMLQRYGDKVVDKDRRERWESTLMDRVHGHGVFIEFGGDSLREHMREGTAP